MELRLPTTNPFASARVRPGAVPFLFRDSDDAQAHVARLQASGWRGQIIGPHGTGKSTLLQALLPAIAAARRSVVWVRPPGWQGVGEASAGPGTKSEGLPLYVIDGFEKFGAMARLRWKLHSTWHGHGLLVTAHRDLGLPTLYETAVDDALAQRVVDKLLGGDESVIGARDVSAALREHRGNLRDALFALYDLYERRKSQPCRIRRN